DSGSEYDTNSSNHFLYGTYFCLCPAFKIASPTTLSVGLAKDLKKNVEQKVDFGLPWHIKKFPLWKCTLNTHLRLLLLLFV
ncbi:hypothetical protein BaRGS_00038868, partial [Batillaria attramentaria]